MTGQIQETGPLPASPAQGELEAEHILQGCPSLSRCAALQPEGQVPRTRRIRLQPPPGRPRNGRSPGADCRRSGRCSARRTRAFPPHSRKTGASQLGVCSRTFRRCVYRYGEESYQWLPDRRMSEVSHRKASVDEVMQVAVQYRGITRI